MLEPYGTNRKMDVNRYTIDKTLVFENSFNLMLPSVF